MVNTMIFAVKDRILEVNRVYTPSNFMYNGEFFETGQSFFIHRECTKKEYLERNENLTIEDLEMDLRGLFESRNYKFYEVSTD